MELRRYKSVQLSNKKTINLGIGKWRDNLFSNIIFDFDGVILNSLKVQQKALFQSFREVYKHEKYPSFKEFLSYSGDSIENIFTKMNLSLNMISKYREVSRNSIDELEIFQGIEKLLEDIQKLDFRCGLCTGKDKERTHEILEYFGLKKYFHVIICSDEVENPKPHPDGIIHILNKLDANIDNTVMIGDAENDILAAKGASIPSIGVTWGSSNRQELEQYYPQYIVDSIEELYQYIIPKGQK